ncbi:MAG: WD40 repeat domain-containing protein [Tannerellaceae bacterium]|nr:WD40 repeat domain-containing protein [Tannerellaceae bacterium]
MNNLTRKKKIALIALMGCLASPLFAQVEELKVYNLKSKINHLENATYRVMYYNGKDVCTYGDRLVFTQPKMRTMALNPAASSIAVIDKKGRVQIYSCDKSSTVLHKIKDKRKKLPGKPSAISLGYSANARNLVVGNNLGELLIYDTRDYTVKSIITGSGPAEIIQLSPDNYFIAAVRGNEIDIWNFETQALRTQLSTEAPVTYVAFSTDASMMATAHENGQISIWNTRTWENVYTYEADAPVNLSAFNQDDKYLAFVENNDEIIILNLRTKAVTQKLPGNAGVVGLSFFGNALQEKNHLLSNRTKSIVYWDTNGLNPFYGKLINQEVDQLMNDWVKMMQDETLEEYRIRVNDETRARQQELFSIDAATRLAGDRIAIDNPFTKDYSATTGLLGIGFNTMGDIEIPVRSDEVDAFSDASNLSFQNAQYVINENDEFEIAYVEVLNEVTGKVYIYDNIGRLKLTAMTDDEFFVPLEIMQQVSEEGLKLQDLSMEVIEESKEEQLITDNTQIQVNTEVVAGVDADGNKIYNYKVGYQYEVINRNFSANEDFPSGGYDITRSNAAMSLMKIIKQSFEEGDFAKYLSQGKRVQVKITGSADASPIRGRIGYDGRYGDFVNEPYYNNGELDNITVTKASGVTENPQLALLRAASVKHYLENNISTLQDTRNDYDFYVEVSTEKGGEYRKINVEFTIVDAF